MAKAVSSVLVGVALLALGPAQDFGGEPNPELVELNKLSFFYGREYFVLRSGRAQMVIQADRADLGPAFTYLLFDCAGRPTERDEGRAR